MEGHRLVFVGGLHRSGTTLLARCVAAHPLVAGFEGTGVPADEGQHLQSVFLPAKAHGGTGRFGFDPAAHLTEDSPLVSDENRTRLLAEWGPHWDLEKPVLLEKSPPNLIRTRFLQALFPDARFLIVMRHPVAVAYATQKWRPTSIGSLIEHWLVCHEIFAADREHVANVHVVRFEDLARDPEGCLDEVFAFLGLEPVRPAVEVRADANEPYFRRWESGGPVRRIERALLTSRLEARANAFDYSLRDLRRVPVPV